MRSSEKRLLALAAVLASVAWAPRADAQQQTQGFGVERLYLSSPGGGWFVMDALDMHGGLGGGASFTVSGAHGPLRVSTPDGAQRLTVVSGQAFADYAFAATYRRYRLSIGFHMPLYGSGSTGDVGSLHFTAPDVDPSSHPDLVSDLRIGFDARLLGEADSAFRLGASAQLFIPNGTPADYTTDGGPRAMFRVLAAGDVAWLTYAAHLGVHVRPRDDSPEPGPQGSELLFGAAGGVKTPLGKSRGAALVVGPELFGASAFRSLLSTSSTAFEGLLSGRVEGTGANGPQLRVRLGVGAGLNPRFGAPDWRMVVGVELFDHHDWGGPR